MTVRYRAGVVPALLDLIDSGQTHPPDSRRVADIDAQFVAGLVEVSKLDEQLASRPDPGEPGKPARIVDVNHRQQIFWAGRSPVAEVHRPHDVAGHRRKVLRRKADEQVVDARRGREVPDFAVAVDIIAGVDRITVNHHPHNVGTTGHTFIGTRRRQRSATGRVAETSSHRAQTTLYPSRFAAPAMRLARSGWLSGNDSEGRAGIAVSAGRNSARHGVPAKRLL
jgi:hypothetical protein